MSLCLARPTQAAHAAQPLYVAFWDKDEGAFDFDWEKTDLNSRMRVDTISVGANADFPRARITVNPAGEYASGVEIMPELTMGEFADKIDPAQRIVIFAQDHTVSPKDVAETRAFLFDGFLTVPRLRFTEHELDYSVLAISALEREAVQTGAMIAGRWVAYPGAVGADVHHVPAMATVFNFQGRPNRYADLASTSDLPDAYGDFDQVPMFTYDGDPNAVYWTLADVLKYLIVFHFSQVAQVVTDGNGIDRVDATVIADAGPQTLTSPLGATFEDVVATQCPELAVHGMDGVKALLLWCRAAGCAMGQFTLNEDGEPATKLLFWLRGEGGPFSAVGDDESDRTIESTGDRDDTPEELARPIALPAENTELDEADAVDVQRGELLFDAGHCVNSVVRLGDPDRYEVTLGRACASTATDLFKPGWAPDSMAGDDLSGSTADDKVDDIAETLEESPTGDALTMFQRYTRKGPDHYKYPTVLRLWVLNESGEYDGTTFGRSNDETSVWAAAAYNTPYDFHVNAAVPKWTDAAGNGPYDWIPRRRAVQNLLSEPTNKGSQAAQLECSWDAGAHWYPYPGSFDILGRSEPARAQIAVLLTDENLAGVTNDHAVAGDTSGDMSVWAAIVRGTFRIALTCSVAGDNCVTGSAEESATTLPTWGGYTHHVGQIARVETLQRHAMANSRLDGATGWSYTARDDEAKADAQANRFMRMHYARLISGNLVLPYLGNDWLPGDLCRGIQPRGIDFKTTVGDHVRYPEVVRVLLRNGEGGQSTHVTLDDYRAVVRSV